MAAAAYPGPTHLPLDLLPHEDESNSRVRSIISPACCSALWAAAAVALLKGTKVPGVNGTRKNGSKLEPTVALPVVSITKANYKRLFTDKFLKKSDVCVGAYAKYCK